MIGVALFALLVIALIYALGRKTDSDRWLPWIVVATLVFGFQLLAPIWFNK